MQQLAPLPREVGNRLVQLHARVALELILHRVLELRPEAAQVGLEQLQRVLDLGLNQVAHLVLEVGLEFFLPLRFAKDKPPGAPEGEIPLEQFLPFRLATPARLFDPAEKPADLSQGLRFAFLENALEPAELFFVAHDRGEKIAHPQRAVGKDHRRRLADRNQFAQAVLGSVNHEVDMLLERLEMALLPEPFLVHSGGAREQCLPRRDGENRRGESEFCVRGLPQMLLDHFDLARLAQVGLLEHKDHVFEPALVDELEQLPGGSAPRIHDRKNEEHQIRARDEVLRDLLVVGHHRVRPRRVDDVEVLEEIDRLVAFRHLRGNVDGLAPRAVLEDVNAVSCGQHIDPAKLLAEKRVQERRLSRFHLAHDDEEERLAHVPEQVLDRVEHDRLALHVGGQLEQRR